MNKFTYFAYTLPKDRVSLGYVDEASFETTSSGLGDVVTLGEVEYLKLLVAQRSGKNIVIEGGHVVITDLPFEYPSKDEVALALREVRNTRLRESDWSQVPDCPLAGNKDILEYRQKLREVPQEEGFPHVSLPVAPKVLDTSI